MDITKIPIDASSDAPVYQQLAGYFSERIASGELAVGDALPTENALCSALSISRSTVRQAFGLLEDEGVILRRRRAGTRVCKPKLNRNLNNLYNFTTEMHALGLTPSSKVVRFRTIHPSDMVASVLRIASEDSVYYIQRLRLADGEPLLLETTYIPTRFCPGMMRCQLNDSLYATITDATGVAPCEASETYEAVALTKREAELLRAHVGDPALRIIRVSKNATGDTFEYCTILARGDRNKYRVVLKSSGVQYSRVLR